MANPGGGFNAILLLIHYLVMASLGFLVTTLLLGGPLGLVPGLAGLMAVTRQRRAGTLSSYRTFPALWSEARGAWRRGLPALLPVALIMASALLQIEMPSPVALLLLIVCGAWAAMALNHMALRLSLGLSAWGGGLAGARQLLLLAWWHGLAVAGWVGLVLLWPLSPFFVVLFGPALLMLALLRLADMVPIQLLIGEGAGEVKRPQ